MFRLNRSMTRVSGVLIELDEMQKIFETARLKELRGLAREFQCLLNHYLVGTLLPVEDSDWYEFGKIGIARDHRLNPERPALRKPRK
jgi:hypothetical protein